MSGVDFVNNSNRNNRSNNTGYDVEYTNPQTEEDITKPKHGNLLGWAHKSTQSKPAPVKPEPVAQPVAQSATIPSTHVSHAAAYQPVQSAPTVSKPAEKVQSTAVQSQPVTVKLTERHLPPPPPPPIHATATQPVQPKAAVPPVVASQLVHATHPNMPAANQMATQAPQPMVAATPVVPTVAPVMAPKMPTPAATPTPRIIPPAPSAPVATVRPATPTAPVAPVTPLQAARPVAVPAAPAAPATGPAASAVAPAAPMAQRHATSVGEIVAQNVSGMHGEMTHPDLLNAGLTGVNLLPNASLQSVEQTPLYRLLRNATLMVVGCTMVYLALVGYQGFFIWRTRNTLSELTNLDNQITTYRSLQTSINETSDKLTAVQDLLTGHLYWTQWFTFLEQNTLPHVYYSSFSGNANGTMNLQVVAPDYTTISQQINVFQNLPQVHDVSVTTVASSDTSFAQATGDANSSAPDSVQFTLSLQVDPSLLHFQPNGPYEQSN